MNENDIIITTSFDKCLIDNHAPENIKSYVFFNNLKFKNQIKKFNWIPIYQPKLNNKCAFQNKYFVKYLQFLNNSNQCEINNNKDNDNESSLNDESEENNNKDNESSLNDEPEENNNKDNEPSSNDESEENNNKDNEPSSNDESNKNKDNDDESSVSNESIENKNEFQNFYSNFKKKRGRKKKKDIIEGFEDFNKDEFESSMYLDEIKNADTIIYIDPRMNNAYKNLNVYIDKINKFNFENIFVMQSKQNSNKLISCVKGSCSTSVYKCDPQKTIDYLNNEFQKNQNLKLDTIIYDPSILVYKNIHKNKKIYLQFCNQIYNALQETNQKNCVIYFSLYAQMYKEFIDYLNIEHFLYNNNNNNNNNRNDNKNYFKELIKQDIIDLDVKLEEIDYKIPIFIIVHDQFEILKKSIASYETYIKTPIEICFIDNCTTYAPTLEYLKEKEEQGYKVYKNIHNHPRKIKHILKSYLKENLKCKYAVITDPDVELNNVNGDILEYYISLLNKFKCQSVGPHLKIDDIPDYYPLKKKIIGMTDSSHSKIFKHHIHKINYKENQYKINICKIDTTFQLFSTNNIPTWPTNKSIRTHAPYDARHLDWYIDPNNMTECQKFYTDNTTNLSHWNRDIEYNKN